MPVIDDVGSGALADGLELLREEPTVRRSVRAGAALVCFSGDKLLGGPQAGLIVGRADAVAAARAHPLARALRLDKLGLAALEATLQLYRDPERARREIPVLAMLTADEDDAARARGSGWRRRSARPRSSSRPPRGSAAARCRCSSCPGPAVAVELAGVGPDELAARLRAADPPVVGRIEDGRLLLDPRTLADDELLLVAARLRMTTLGTAGHIDHGKTALVRALTGVDTDRLPEERERGISIALGYAPLTLPSGRALSVVDVPGHERFVRTMVAGATGIDLYLMTVAADDGVMPQTREHAAVLAALGVDVGVVAITKADLADPARALAEAAALLPNAEAVVGLCPHRRRARRVARRARPSGGARAGARSASLAALRLHVDRVFTIHGAGTVVTGTLWSGTVGRGDEVTIQPAGRRAPGARRRGPRRAGRPRRRRPARGAQPRRARPGRGRARRRGRRRRHARRRPIASTRRSPGRRPTRARTAARGSPSTTARASRRRGSPSSADGSSSCGWSSRSSRSRGDRLVIRSLAPPDTLGGGVVLDPAPRRHGPSRDVLARLAALERGEEPAPPPPDQGPTVRPVAARAPGADAVRARGRGAAAGGRRGAAARRRARRRAGRPRGAARARPRGPARAHACTSTPRRSRPSRARIVAAIERDGSITLAGARDELGTSRKYAQAYLEHLDAARVTLRRGDERVLRRRR